MIVVSTLSPLLCTVISMGLSSRVLPMTTAHAIPETMPPKPIPVSTMRPAAVSGKFDSASCTADTSPRVGSSRTMPAATEYWGDEMNPT